MRRGLFVALACVIVTGLAVLPASTAGARGKGKSQPVKVAEDAAGDWGEGQAPGELGHYLGQDLISASIGMADKKTLELLLEVSFLPPWGGWPELTRYVWGITVDGEYVEFDGKFTNYSRGACDPTSGQCPPPRDPGMQPFLVRGNCVTDPSANLTTCEELGFVQATFEPGENLIRIPAPLKLIGAKKRSLIEAGPSDFTTAAGGTIVAVPSAFFSSTAMPLDAMTQIGKFRVPKR